MLRSNSLPREDALALKRRCCGISPDQHVSDRFADTWRLGFASENEVAERYRLQREGATNKLSRMAFPHQPCSYVSRRQLEAKNSFVWCLSQRAQVSTSTRHERKGFFLLPCNNVRFSTFDIVTSRKNFRIPKFFSGLVLCIHTNSSKLQRPFLRSSRKPLVCSKHHLFTMSDRYQGSAYRRGGPPPRDDRRYPPRHHRDDHDYPDPRPYGDPRDSYPHSYYPEHRGYGSGRPPRRVHKAIPPPRPWDYSRRPLPRNEQERIELEREREAWEAKEAERYRQRMEERERERERDAQRGHAGPHSGWDRDYDADERMYGPPEGYDRERARHPEHALLGPRRPRSRSPGQDPRYEQRGSWGRASIGSSEGRERDADRLAAAPAADRAAAAEAARYPEDAYHRRSPPPSAPASHFDTPEAQRYAAASDRPGSPPRGTPRGPAARTAAVDVPSAPGFGATPPTGPRAGPGGYGRRGGPPLPSPAFRGGREGSGSAGPYTPGSERGDREASTYLSPSNARFPRSARDGPIPSGPYRGGHPSFGRGRRDTNPYDSHFASAAGDEEAAYRAGYAGGHAGSSPHEASPFSPSTATPGGGLTAPRLSRTSSSQTPLTPTTAIPTGPSATIATGKNSPSTHTPNLPTTSTVAHFSSAHKLCPDLDADLQAIEIQRNTFISNHILGSKRTAVRTARMELKDAELDHSTASARRQAAEKALEVARETADAYSLEENRKEELQRLMAQQLQQQATAV